MIGFLFGSVRVKFLFMWELSVFRVLNSSGGRLLLLIEVYRNFLFIWEGVMVLRIL